MTKKVVILEYNYQLIYNLNQKKFENKKIETLLRRGVQEFNLDVIEDFTQKLDTPVKESLL